LLSDTLTSYGVECLLRLKGVQVTQIFRQLIRVYLRLSAVNLIVPTCNVTVLLTAVAGVVCGVVMYAAAGLLADVFGMPQPGGW